MVCVRDWVQSVGHVAVKCMRACLVGRCGQVWNDIAEALMKTIRLGEGKRCSDGMAWHGMAWQP